MNIQVAQGFNIAERCRFAKGKVLACVLAVSGIIACYGIVCLMPKSNTVEITFDKRIQSGVESVRRKADVERERWKQNEQSRVEDEKRRLLALDVPDLAKKSVVILACAEKPDYIVNKAIVTTEKELDCTIVRPPWGKSTDPDKNVFWAIVCREKRDEDHDWWVEQNSAFGQYRLVGNPNQKVYFSIHDIDKLRRILMHIALIGNFSKPFYQVVADDEEEIKEGCRPLSLSEVKSIFPETPNVRAGVYAQHPGNAYALIPVGDYCATMTLDRCVECVVLLGKMGAKSVRVSRANGEENLVGGGVKASVYGRGASVAGEFSSKAKRQREISVVFEGSSDVVVSSDLLENSVWHKHDVHLNAILSVRLSGNKLKEYAFKESQKSECNFDFHLAARLLGIVESKLKADYENAMSESRTFHVVF